jgi:hypothetical protein
MIRTLLLEMHIETFEVTKAYVLSQLRANEGTADFATYFESNYSACAKLWAYCYRTNCGVNTNMALERMHGLLKHSYQNGKRNKRLDTAIQALTYMLQDKQVDRLLSLCRGKYSRKLAELHKRHDISLSLNVQCYEISPQREWSVQSSSDLEDFFNVTRTDKRCNSCDLRCVECHACIHDFLCTCADMGNKYNMCKHIHYVCTKYPREIVDVETASDDQLLVIDD